MVNNLQTTLGLSNSMSAVLRHQETRALDAVRAAENVLKTTLCQNCSAHQRGDRRLKISEEIRKHKS